MKKSGVDNYELLPSLRGDVHLHAATMEENADNEPDEYVKISFYNRIYTATLG